MAKPTSTIVVFKNRATGAVLSHDKGECVQATDNDEWDPTHQWHRLPQEDGSHVTYRNVASDKLLEHYNGDSIEAFHAVQTSQSQQWLEVNVGSVFLAVANRATGKTLDHYYEQAIQAYNGDVNNHHHQWIVQPPQSLPPSRSEFPVVVIKNRATGVVLDHYMGECIQAKDQDETHPNHQWYREPWLDGYVAYRNLATGKLLEHHRGKTIEAFHAVRTRTHQQWKEHDVGDGFVAIVNRGTGKALDHWWEKAIKALNGDKNNLHHQWRVVPVSAVAHKSTDTLGSEMPMVVPVAYTKDALN